MKFFGPRRDSGSSGPSPGPEDDQTAPQRRKGIQARRERTGSSPDPRTQDRSDRTESAVLHALGPPHGKKPPLPVPTRLSKDRVARWLERSGATFFTDSDGDLGGLWHGRLFYFLVLGDHDEVLQVRAQWQRVASIERIAELLELCNAWNADHIWPKAYTRVRDDGGVVVCAETTVDVEHGATDDQLDQLLQCGLMTSLMFFDSLDAEYPDPLREAP